MRDGMINDGQHERLETPVAEARKLKDEPLNSGPGTSDFGGAD